VKEAGKGARTDTAPRPSCPRHPPPTPPAPQIVTDFTGVVQTRGPGELGGIYWCFNLFLALATVLAVVPAAFSTGKMEGISETWMYNVVYLGTAGWLFTFLVFILLMKKQYVRAKRA
jgi:hypothetical protein